MNAILAALPWGKIIEFALMLVGKGIKHKGELDKLELEWVKLTKAIDRRIPIKVSDRAMILIRNLEYEENLQKQMQVGMSVAVKEKIFHAESLLSEAVTRNAELESVIKILKKKNKKLINQKQRNENV